MTMTDDRIRVDNVSEKYQKYLLAFRRKKTSLNTLYGADVSTKNEDDKFLVDEHGNILTFETPSELKSRILKNSNLLLFDQENVLAWAKYHEGAQPHSTFDLDHLLSTVDHLVRLPELTKDASIEITNFINLFGDYAYQTNDEIFLNCHRKKCVRNFFDFTYDNYVWDSPHNTGFHSLQEIDFLQFDEEDFKKTVERMVSMFVNKIHIGR